MYPVRLYLPDKWRLMPNKAKNQFVSKPCFQRSRRRRSRLVGRPAPGWRLPWSATALAADLTDGTSPPDVGRSWVGVNSSKSSAASLAGPRRLAKAFTEMTRTLGPREIVMTSSVRTSWLALDMRTRFIRTLPRAISACAKDLVLANRAYQSQTSILWAALVCGRPLKFCSRSPLSPCCS